MKEQTIEKEITASSEAESVSAPQEETEVPVDPSDAQEEFSEQYKSLPIWKQIVILVLFLGGMTAVIMLINFVVEFGAELIKALIN